MSWFCMKSQQKSCIFHKTRCRNARTFGIMTSGFMESVGFHLVLPEKKNTTFPSSGLDLFFPVKKSGNF